MKLKLNWIIQNKNKNGKLNRKQIKNMKKLKIMCDVIDGMNTYHLNDEQVMTLIKWKKKPIFD